MGLLSFSIALEMLKHGERVTRAAWSTDCGPNTMWLQLQRPDQNSKMTKPYIFLTTQFGTVVPWVATQGDLISEDWHQVVPA